MRASFVANTVFMNFLLEPLLFFLFFFFFLPKEVLMSVSEHSSGVPVMYIIHYRHCCVQKHFNRAVVLSSLLKTTALLK